MLTGRVGYRGIGGDEQVRGGDEQVRVGGTKEWGVTLFSAKG
jgi:hypothetical protein